MVTSDRFGSVTGVVLAGGKSRRMGRDKARMPFRGRPLLEHMLGLLAQGGATPCLVSGRYAGYDCIPDMDADGGPIAGILAVAEALPGQRLLFVPVDMPLLDPALIRRLLAEAADAICVRFEDYALPMRLDAMPFVRDRLRAAMRETGRRRSVLALQAAVGAASLPLGAADAAAMGNCNTPEEWEGALRAPAPLRTP